jgi:hypothetical protein
MKMRNHKKRKRVYWSVNEWLYPEQITTEQTHLAAIILLAFKSTISSNPIAKISIGGSSSGTLVTSTSAVNKTRTTFP